MSQHPRLTDEVRCDLRQIAFFLEEQAGEITSIRFLDAAIGAFVMLAAQPGLGGRFESKRARCSDIRVWPISEFPNHLVFYHEIDGGVEILRVVQGARDLTKLF